MPSLFELIPLIAEQALTRQQLQRTPEPTSVMDEEASVEQYDQALSSKLALVYALGLEIIHRARDDRASGKALDLACGPGHFTLQLSKYLNYREVIGVDLSPGMIDLAIQHARSSGRQHQVQFRLNDVTNLADVPDESFDLTTFADAAHHMPDLETVGNVLREMERVTSARGLIFVTDLVRLHTRNATEKYVKIIGADYVARGLDAFFQDFHNSMYAAWCPEELRQAVPKSTKRNWVHIVPLGLPTLQMLIGLPEGQIRLLRRSGHPWSGSNSPFPSGMRQDWLLLRQSALLRCYLGPTRVHAMATDVPPRPETKKGVAPLEEATPA